MALKKTKSGSALTVSLILLLTITFLAPLYHSHNHAEDHHQENNYDHVLLHDGSGHEGLSDSEQHNDPHLHIKKDVGITDTRLHLNGKSLNPDLWTVTGSPVSTEHISSTYAKHTQSPIFRSSSYDCLSGLSPPTA